MGRQIHANLHLMEYSANITQSAIGNGRTGINVRIIRTSDSVEVGKILTLLPTDEAAAYVASVNELLDKHPDVKRNENYNG